MAYRLKMNKEGKVEAEEEEENCRMIRVKAFGISAAVVLFVLGVVLFVGYEIGLSEFH